MGTRQLRTCLEVRASQPRRGGKWRALLLLALGLGFAGAASVLAQAQAQAPLQQLLQKDDGKGLPKMPPALEEKIPGPVLPMLPPPRLVAPPLLPLSPFGPNQFRLQCLDDLPRSIGTTPLPSKQTYEKFGKYVKDLIDTELSLDLVVNQTRLMIFKKAPKRIQIADETIANYSLLSPTELSLLGKGVGSTVLTLWFLDDQGKETILTYQLRVVSDPEARRRLERVYKALADEINHAFPDSVICLNLVGDKLVVSGNARDVADAAHIMRIVRANAPGGGRGGKGGADVAKVPVGAPVSQANGMGLPGPTLEQYELAEQHNPTVINLMRINGEQQVMLKVTVAEVNRAAARSIGLNFSITSNAGTTVFANHTGGIAGSTGTNSFAASSIFPNFNGGASTGFNNLSAALDNGRISLAISALRELNYAKSLAEPNLVTLNGQTAYFQAGGEFPVPVVTSSVATVGALQGVSFVPFGVQLQFTPYITDRDRVRLAVSANVSSRDLSAGQTTIGTTSVPTLSTRNFRTTVELRSGETLAVAGLIQNNLGADSQRVPFLGDLPIVGHLFGFDRISAGEQELVVLITPELVHPLAHKEVPQLPGWNLLEPSDLEFYLLGRLESHHPVDFRSPVRTDWRRLHQNRYMENLYLNGPHGPVEPNGNGNDH